jgi:hypothetical protein
MFLATVWLAGLLALAACQGSDFAGQAPQQANDSAEDDDEDDDRDDDGDDDADLSTSTDQLGQTETIQGVSTATDGSTGTGGLATGTDQGQGEPVGLQTIDGRIVTTPNYTACAALPQAGKRGYGKCDANQVVVIVNDGEAQEMTCCPVVAQNILSTKPDEVQIQRTGVCQANEVCTGMIDPHDPGIYCTKINTQFMQLSTPIASTYVQGNAPGVLGQIAATYNVSDTCICPEGTVAIGGHTASDNRCAEQCVRLERKP